MLTLQEIWPLFALRIRCGPLEMSAIRDDDIPALVALAQGGIHDPAEMPFLFPWTDTPADELPKAMAVHYWDARARTTPDAWSLELVVRRDGVPVGVQAYRTEHFAVTHTGETGSWLCRRYQGQGTGTLMRQAICAFVFDFLGAEEVMSAGFVDNPASLAVSRKVGYSDNGVTRESRRQGELVLCNRLVLRPENLVRPPYPVEADGVPEVRAFLGL